MNTAEESPGIGRWFRGKLVGVFKRSSKPITQEEALTALHTWAEKMRMKDPQVVTALYGRKTVFIGTMAERTSQTSKSHAAYFVNFFKGKHDLSVQIDSANIQLQDDIAVASGRYTFSFRENPDRPDTCIFPARYTFMFKRAEDGTIKIIHHHSSANPQIKQTYEIRENGQHPDGQS